MGLWSECGDGCVYIEGRKQWNGREDEKSMTIIVSYARYICTDT